MTRLVFVRSTALALAAWGLCEMLAASCAQAQVLQQVEKDVRRQVGAGSAASPKRDPLGLPETPAEPPGYLGLFAGEPKAAGRGLRILEVIKGGPAEKAGLTTNDVIMAVNGTMAHSLDDMAQVLAPLGAGRRVDFTIQRIGVQMQVPVTLGVRPSRPDSRATNYGRQAELPAPSNPAAGGGLAASPLAPSGVIAAGGPLLGVRTVMLDGERRGLFKISASTFGALVTSVVAGSAADRIGIQPGVLITSFNGQTVDGPPTLAGLVRAAGPNQQVDVGWVDQNGDAHRQMTITGGGPPADPNAAMIPHTSLDPNGDMPPEIGLPQEIPPGPGMYIPPGASQRQAEIEALREKVDSLEARIKKLEAALEPTTKPEAEAKP